MHFHKIYHAVVIFTFLFPIYFGTQAIAQQDAEDNEYLRCGFKLPCIMNLPEIESLGDNLVRASYISGPFYNTGEIIEIVPYYSHAIITIRGAGIDLMKEQPSGWEFQGTTHYVVTLEEWEDFLTSFQNSNQNLETARTASNYRPGQYCSDLGYSLIEQVLPSGAIKKAGSGCAEDDPNYGFTYAIYELINTRSEQLAGR